MAAFSGKAAAALVMLVALLAAGTRPAAAGANIIGQGCFVGWSPLGLLLSIFNCLLGSNPFGPPMPEPTGQGLTVGYYNYSSISGNRNCSNVEQLIRQAVEAALNSNRSTGAGIIRLHFHDAFVRGCDGSVLLNTTKSGNSDTERTGRPNANSLRDLAFQAIDDAKTAVEAACPGRVSCADILAFAAREASRILSYGNIYYEVPAGRLDGLESFASETNRLPGPDSTLSDLNNSFWAQGLSIADMVALSGAHTIGNARCFLFQDHLPDMDPVYANYLRGLCNAGPSFRVNQTKRDVDILDNQYYKNIDKFVLFKSDAALNSSVTIDQVTKYVNYASNWYTDFGNAMVKMGKIINTTYPGEIRTQCWKINGGSY